MRLSTGNICVCISSHKVVLLPPIHCCEHIHAKCDLDRDLLNILVGLPSSSALPEGTTEGGDQVHTALTGACSSGMLW